MISILGRGLIQWSGIIAGAALVLSFLGCRCFMGDKIKLPMWLTKQHALLMKTALIFFLIHLGLIILGKSFGIYF